MSNITLDDTLYYETSEGTQIGSLVIGSIAIVVSLVQLFLSYKYSRNFPYSKHIKGFFLNMSVAIIVVVLVYLNYQRGLNVTAGTRFGNLLELWAQEILLNSVIFQVWRLYLQTAYQRALLEGHYSSKLIANMRKYSKLLSMRNAVILSLLEAVILFFVSDSANHDRLSFEYTITSVILLLQPVIAAIVFMIKFNKLNANFKDGTGIMFEIKMAAIFWFVGLLVTFAFDDDDGAIYMGVTPYTFYYLFLSVYCSQKFYKKKNVVANVTPEEVELTIKHPSSADNFAKFLAGEFSSENFYFIVLVLRLINKGKVESAGTADGLLAKTVKTSKGDELEEEEKSEGEKKDELLDSMRSCYNRFVAINSAYQVNLPGGLIKKFKKAFDKDEQDTHVLMELFLKAKKEIIGLLVRDPFKRWKDSPLYVAVDDINTKIKKTDKLLTTKQDDDSENNQVSV